MVESSFGNFEIDQPDQNVVNTSEAEEINRAQSLRSLKLKLLIKHLCRSRVIAVGLIFIFTCLMCAISIEVYLRFFLGDVVASTPRGYQNQSKNNTGSSFVEVPKQTTKRRVNIVKNTLSVNKKKSNTTTTTNISIGTDTLDLPVDEPVVITENSSTRTEFSEPSTRKTSTSTSLTGTSVDPEIVVVSEPATPTSITKATNTGTNTDITTSTNTESSTSTESPVQQPPASSRPSQPLFLYCSDCEESDSEVEVQSDSLINPPVNMARNADSVERIVKLNLVQKLILGHKEQELQRINNERAVEQAEILRLRQELADKEAENQTLRVSNNLNRVINQQNAARLQNDLATDQLHIAQLRQTLESKNDELLALQQANITEQTNLRRELNQSQLDVTQLRQELENKNAEIHALHQANATGQTEYTALQQELSQLRLNLAELREQMVKMAFDRPSTRNSGLFSTDSSLNSSISTLDCVEDSQENVPIDEGVLSDVLSSGLLNLVKFKTVSSRVQISTYSDILLNAVPFSIINTSPLSQQILRKFCSTLISRLFEERLNLPESLHTDLQAWLTRFSRSPQFKHFVRFSEIWKTVCQFIQADRQLTKNFESVSFNEDVSISVADLRTYHNPTSGIGTCPFLRNSVSSLNNPVDVPAQLNQLYQLICDIYLRLHNVPEPPSLPPPYLEKGPDQQAQLDEYIHFYNEMVRNFSLSDHELASEVFKSIRN